MFELCAEFQIQNVVVKVSVRGREKEVVGIDMDVKVGTPAEALIELLRLDTRADSSRNSLEIDDDFDADENASEDAEREADLSTASTASNSPHGMMMDDEQALPASCGSWFSSSWKAKFVQRAMVEKLQQMTEQFSREKHEDELQKLWRVSKGTQAPPPKGQPSPLWKLVGFQGEDPATDLERSQSGALAVKALLYFATTCQQQYAAALERSQNKYIEKMYPFACAAMHLTEMILKIVGAVETKGKAAQVDAAARKKLCSMLLANQTTAFLDVFCIAFIFLDAEWQRQNGTYFTFNAILESVRVKLVKSLKSKKVATPQQLAQALPVTWQPSV